MRDIPRSVGAAFAAAVVAVAALVGLVLTNDGMSNPGSYRGSLCQNYALAIADVESQYSIGLTTEATEVLNAQMAELRQQAKDDKCTLPAADAAASAATQGAQTTKDEGKKAASDSWKPHYYTLDKGKPSERAFGPSVKGGKKAVDGTKAEKAKALKSIKAEFKERMLRDPALLCGNGGLILKGKDGGKDCVDKLLASKSARDKYYGRVFDEIKSMKVERRYAQSVESAYMVVPKDGVPRIVKIDTYRSEVYYVLVVKTKSGKTYNLRLECGFQWDTGRKVVPRVYTPFLHTPYTPVLPCVNGNDRDGDGRCTVPNQPPSGGCKKNCGNTAKDPSEDPAQKGNAGNGGGKNQNPGSGATTNPTHAPDQPRENPAQPTTGSGGSDGGSGDGGGSTHVDTEPDAPQPTDPATGTVKDS